MAIPFGRDDVKDVVTDSSLRGRHRSLTELSSTSLAYSFQGTNTIRPHRCALLYISKPVASEET
jgi:CRISPR/Cas system CSM-associated protein Csm3 (group 7 of RAMP superfamily)